MNQSIKVRKFQQHTLLLLQKTSGRISLDTASVPVFLEMLAEPYPLEDDQLSRLQHLAEVDLQVQPGGSKMKTVLTLNPPVSIVPLDAAGVARLTKQLTALAV